VGPIRRQCTDYVAVSEAEHHAGGGRYACVFEFMDAELAKWGPVVRAAKIEM
jgi:hypothetical protein